MRVFVIIGTRPEAIKMLPLVIELRKNNKFETKICFSGQHREMAKSVFNEFKISPDFTFEERKKCRTLCEMTIGFLNYFDVLFREQKPELILVHGDTTTAFCASLSAFYLGIKVCHVEAGLRTFDTLSPFPEEFNRVAIDSLSCVHFAPTESAAKNLSKEGRKSVFIVGNTVIDALKYSLEKEIFLPILDEMRERKLVLITTHRRENLGEKMRSAMLGIRDVLKTREDLFAILPAHPNPEVREVVRGAFKNIKNLKMCEPLPMCEFHHLLSQSFAIFTDSGGIQEEAAYLGVPLFLLRENTEREECRALPNVRVIGCDRETVRESFISFLNNEKNLKKARSPSYIFGDGSASKNIVQCLSKSIFYV